MNWKLEHVLVVAIFPCRIEVAQITNALVEVLHSSHHSSVSLLDLECYLPRKFLVSKTFELDQLTLNAHMAFSVEVDMRSRPRILKPLSFPHHQTEQARRLSLNYRRHCGRIPRWDYCYQILR